MTLREAMAGIPESPRLTARLDGGIDRWKVVSGRR
jgi:hypothetical protein